MIIKVVAAIIEHDNRLLICQRRRGTSFGMKWEFPGGKVQAGETPEAALARELREELDVQATVGRLIHQARHQHEEMRGELELSFFSAAINASHTPAKHSAREADEFPAVRNMVFERIEWVRRSDLETYDFLPADRQLVHQLARGEFAEPEKQDKQGD